jgi:serine/threonine protein kinase
MGIVYRVVDLKLNREVAIKVLPPELVADPERKRRLIQEAQAVAALNHPNIATIHEIDEAGGTNFIAMERIEGRSSVNCFPEDRFPSLARSRSPRRLPKVSRALTKKGSSTGISSPRTSW